LLKRSLHEVGRSHSRIRKSIDFGLVTPLQALLSQVSNGLCCNHVSELGLVLIRDLEVLG
ncbi:MAG: hypothetical protein VX527_04060, partial [Planctomycetota bacterium]|nr:hypothetical protein [Planctomycetota bacterium]